MEKFKSRKYHLTSKLVLLKAINYIYPSFQVIFRNSLNNGVYVTINGKNYVTEEEVKKIETRMNEIVAKKKMIK
ncbi:MAG: nucleoside kinase, partial [Cetobacterium sp.]